MQKKSTQKQQKIYIKKGLKLKKNYKKSTKIKKFLKDLKKS